MSSKDHDCQSFADHLASAIAGGGEPSVEEIRKLAECDRCRTLFASVVTLLGDEGTEFSLPPDAELRARQAAGKIARRSWRIGSAIRMCFGLVVGAAVFLVLEWADLAKLWFVSEAPIAWLGGGLLLEVARAGIPTLLIAWLFCLGSVRRERGARPQRLYCRWEGRQVQGICVGLSEYFAIPVWIPRAVFLVLMLFGLGGVSVYIAATLGLSFHPNDRQHMLRFRVRRLLERWRGDTSEA